MKKSIAMKRRVSFILAGILLMASINTVYALETGTEKIVSNMRPFVLLPIFLDLYLPWLPVTELTNIMTLS